MSGDKVWIAEQGDAVSGATPLGDALARTTVLIKLTYLQPWICSMGFIPGSIGETSTLAIFIGALILVIYRNGKLADHALGICRRTGDRIYL